MTALLKPHLNAIVVIFYAHNDDINTCARNQRDYTLELFEWVEEGFRVTMWEWKKVKERLCGFHVSVTVIFSVKQREYSRAVMHKYEFVGWSPLDIGHSDSEGEGLSFGELIGNATVSPLKPCIYALLMKCDREWAGCVCIRERMYLFMGVHIWMLAPHEHIKHSVSRLFSICAELWIWALLIWAGFVWFFLTYDNF